MPSNPDSQFAFRAVELAQFYDENYGRSSRHQVAKIDLERYRFLIEESLPFGSAQGKPKLSEGEAIALYSALNGANTSHVEMLPILKQSIISELIEDEELELAHKIKDWSLTQWFAAVDACGRVGGDSYQVENLCEELKRVGLA